MQPFSRIAPLVMAAMFPAGVASAQEEIDFDRYDTDGDGFLTQSEWRAVGNVSASFDSMDTNRDGRLSKGEVEAGLTVEERNIDYELDEGSEQQDIVTSPVSDVENQPRNVGMYDTDNDGRVSREEAHKDGELVTYFAIWDTDDDGYLDQDEINQGSSDVQRERRNVEYRGEPAVTPPQTGTEGEAGFQEADANGDNRVSRMEANDANAEYIVLYFDTLDANSDGFVDRNEASADENYWNEDENGASQVDEDEIGGGGDDGAVREE